MVHVLSRCALALFLTVLPIIAASQTSTTTSQTACPSPRSIWLSVVDEKGRTVDKLRTADIVVQREKANLTVLRLEQDRDQPLLLTFLIDTSASQEVPLVLIKKIANDLLKSILRPGKDQAEVLSFEMKLTSLQEPTNDLAKLSAAIEGLRAVVPPSYVRGGRLVVGRPPTNTGPLPGSTTIWDSIWNSLELRSGSNATRRAMVIFTDGVDTGSKRKLRDVLQRAAQDNLAVFAVGIGDEQINGVNRSDLRELTEKTGGQAFFPKKEKDLSQLVDEATQAIRSAYRLTYCSDDATNGLGKLKISVGDQVPDGRKLKLSYPRSGS